MVLPELREGRRAGWWDMMSRFSAHNMRGLSYRPGYCAICGRPHPEGHHVVARSLGGGDGPVIDLCGRGVSAGLN